MSGSLHGRSFTLVCGSRSVFDFGTLKYFFAVLESYGVFVYLLVERCGIRYVAGYRCDFFIPTFESVSKLSGSLPGRSFALVFGSRSVLYFGTLKRFVAVLEIYGVFSRNVSVSCIISRIAGYADRGNFFATLFRRIPTVKSIDFVNCVTIGGVGNGYGRAMRKFIGSDYRFSELEYDCILSYARREMRIVRSVTGYREIGNRVAAFFRSIPAVERIRIDFRGSLRRICGNDCRRAVFYGLSFSYLFTVADKLYFVFILNRI